MSHPHQHSHTQPTRNGVLPSGHIRAVEAGGFPHAAIREDIGHDLLALEGPAIVAPAHHGVGVDEIASGVVAAWGRAA